MEFVEAKAKLRSAYALLEELPVEQQSETGATPMVMLDEKKIVMIKPDLVDFEEDSLRAEFFQKHRELWREIEAESWEDSEARQLVEFDNQLWRQRFA